MPTAGADTGQRVGVRRGRPGRAGLLAVLVAGSTLVQGCGSDGSRDAAAEAGASRSGQPPVSLTAVAVQTRPDQAAGDRFQAKVTNRSDVPLTVLSVQLQAAGFAPQPPDAKDVEFAPGSTYDLQTALGAVDCATAEPGPLVLAVRVRAQQQEFDMQVPLASDDGTMQRVHTRGCAQQALLREVGVELLPGLRRRPDRQDLTGVLRLTRRAAAGAVRVSEIRGSVVYDLAAPSLPTVLPKGAGHLDIPLRITPATCEGHAIGESKKPFVFLLFVELDGQEALGTLVPVDDRQRQDLQSYQRQACRP